MGVNPKDLAAKAITGFHQVLLKASGGKVGNRIAGMPVVLLTTTGRRSGQPRTTPLTAVEHEGRTFLVASYGGDDRHPAWYLNLREHPEVVLQRDGTSDRMVARTLTSDERAEVWPIVTTTYSGYAGYQRRTDREIPVVELVPAPIVT